MKTRYSVIWVVMLVTLGFGCGGSVAGPEGVRWRLTELNQETVTLPVKGELPNLLLDPAEHRVTGFSGCNTYFSNYTLEGNALQFGPMGSTRMACPDLDVPETEFLAQLSTIDHWEIQGGLLLLSAGGAVVAKFERQPED